MPGHYNGGTRQYTMERVNKNHIIQKWGFYLTSGEVYKNWEYSTDRATGTSNRIIVCERGNCLGKIHLSNGTYNYEVWSNLYMTGTVISST